MGLWMQLHTALTNQDFTFETFIYLNNLLPAYSEYKMQNFVSSFWMSDNKGIELRTLGTGAAEGVIQLMTHDGVGEHNITSAGGVLQTGQWYHAAAVYTHADQAIKLYIDKNLIGSANTNWSSYTMQWLCLAAWPNPAGSARDLSGYMDAFALSDAALAPADFVLYQLPPTPSPSPTEVPTPTNAPAAAGKNWSLLK